ncbi:MAG: TOBE domain-containing protein, partial [Anaerolineales bacterium]
VMNLGLLQQIADPQSLYDSPDNLFVAGFIGSPAMNFFPGTMRKDDGKVYVDGGSFNVQIPEDRTSTYAPYTDKDVIFGIRPEDIINPDFTPPGIIDQPVECTVDVTELMGNEIFVYLKNGDHNFIARVDPRSRYKVNEKATVIFNMNNMHIFDTDTEHAVR